MRAVDYSEVLYGSAALAGFGKGDIGSPEFALFRTFHDRRLQMAWEIHKWPDLCPIEQRQYRPNYNAGTTYGVNTDPTLDNSANEVYDIPTCSYYQSLQAANSGNSPSVGGVENSAWFAVCQNQYSASDWLANTQFTCTNGAASQVRNPADNRYYQCIVTHVSGATFDATKWGLLTPFNKYVAFQQTTGTGTVLTPIGELFRAFDKDPRVTTMLRKFPFMVSQVGFQFGACVTPLVWLYYRTRRPVLTGDVWDPTLAYAATSQVYFTAVSGGSGNFYTAVAATNAGDSPVSAPAKWAVIQIPYIFRGYLIEGGYADWLTSDGQSDKAQALEPMATSYLELEADKVQRQEQQVSRMSVW